MDPTIIDAVRVRVLERARREAALLWGPDQLDLAQRTAIVEWCHRLRGTAGTVGLTDISAAALAVEDALLNEKPPYWPDLRDRLLATLCDCSQ